MVRQTFVLAWLACVATVTPASHIGAQTDQSALVRDLQSNDHERQQRGLSAAEALGVDSLSAPVREALIRLLEAKNRAARDAARRQVPLARDENPEFLMALARAVAELREPAAIDALAEATLGGPPAMRALGEFGEAALPALLRVSSSPLSDHYAVEHCLVAMRFIVERSGPALSPGGRASVRRVAAERLSGSQYFTTLWHALDLAAVLDDAELRDIMTALATNEGEVRKRGIEQPALISATQRRASERLAGIPALPRP